MRSSVQASPSCRWACPGVPPGKSTDLQDSRVGEPKAKAGHGPSRWRSPGRGPRRRSRRDGLRAASAGPFGSRRDRPTRRAAPDRRKTARDQGPPPPACRASPVAMRRQRTCAEAQMVAAPASPSMALCRVGGLTSPFGSIQRKQAKWLLNVDPGRPSRSAAPWVHSAALPAARAEKTPAHRSTSVPRGTRPSRGRNRHG